MENLNYIYERDLESINFPIEISNVYYDHYGSRKQKHDNSHKALVRGDTGEVLGLVGTKYEVIRHWEAYELGQQLFKKVFGSEPEVFKVDMNRKGSYCHVDILNPRERIVIKDLQKAGRSNDKIREEYFPFIRISNSYNHSFALRYHLGFYRWKCSNGLLMGQDMLGDIVISHDKPLHESESYVMDAAASFAELVGRFDNYIRRAGKIQIPKELLEVVTLDVLDKQYGVDQLPRLLKMTEVLRGAIPAYADELGTSALAAINIATDYIKTIENTHTVNSLQTKAMDWGLRITENGFALNDYLKDQKTYKESVLDKIAW